MVVSLSLNYRRKPTIGRADPPVIPVTDEVSPNENLQFLYGHSLRIVAVIEKLAFHSGPHAFASGIIVAPATSTVHTLNNAYLAYPDLRGAIVHSDRGTQYTSETYRKALAKYGIIQSMNRAGGRCHEMPDAKACGPE